MLTEYRCRYCNALLLKADIVDGVMEIKCRHASCGAINRWHFVAEVDSRTKVAV
ncbi:hypothetical protein LCGC14_1366640 [marine sediment metagenome]|uniref:Uncharacterized protein n=1 Tax=marine sediment metagenome TaxID=412755 RepID=A0A0F9K743_9ZZZZ